MQNNQGISFYDMLYFFEINKKCNTKLTNSYKKNV